MIKARAVLSPLSKMNKTEARYAREILEVQLRARDILWYRYEPMKLQLGDELTYTPDFMSISAVDGEIQCHEVKAIWSTGRAGFKDDARAKIKMAAQMFPFFSFVVAAYQSTSRKHVRVPGWHFEAIHARDVALPLTIKSELPPE